MEFLDVHHNRRDTQVFEFYYFRLNFFEFDNFYFFNNRMY